MRLQKHGFTLLEVMMVVAIIGVLTAIAVSSMEGLRRRTGPRNEAANFSAALSQARNRAMERGSEVWLIIYPGIKTDGSAGGSGAWFLYEDGDTNFSVAGSQPCDGTGGCNYESFQPPNKIAPLATGTDRFLEANYFDRVTPRNVRFGNSVNPTFAYAEPFAALNGGAISRDCTFCSGTGAQRRGAIVFNGDGAARFVDKDGALVFAPTSGALIGGVAIEGTASKQLTYFAISGVTGYVGLFQ